MTDKKKPENKANSTDWEKKASGKDKPTVLISQTLPPPAPKPIPKDKR